MNSQWISARPVVPPGQQRSGSRRKDVAAGALGGGRGGLSGRMERRLQPHGRGGSQVLRAPLGGSHMDLKVSRKGASPPDQTGQSHRWTKGTIMTKFAFYGRVSTEDQQDPTSSMQ